ncbi:MAG: TadE/TadG family protein [Fulvimarina manganoxydans]|uniref:TadE/TadG family type IV pilus assembly protein n=1 Tax=Fulvimarina manganoxydans TaxID=937218 RepID=UPI0023542AA8|nr:TadE/TadG family type IV pilus assembly protein [Fulvimarina manganoxydans]MCK5933264.1 TadE/TadG family protein [Fulvimarina manganoxydans]
MMHPVALVRRWLRDANANVAMIFALVLPVLVLGAGSAVDFGGAVMAEQEIQSSIDKAALVAARRAGALDEQGLKSIADAFFFENISDERRQDTVLRYEGIEKIAGNRVLTLSATRNYKALFANALRYVSNGTLNWDPLPITVRTQIVIENRSIDMALVLDNSGSMAWAEGVPNTSAPNGQSKLDKLKDAAQSLVKDLMAVNSEAIGEPPVRIGIVPFSSAVNVGKAYQNADWIDRFGESSIHHENLDWGRWQDYDGTKLAKKEGRRWVRVSDGQILTRQWLYDNAKVVSGYSTCGWKNWAKRCWPVAYRTYQDGQQRFPGGWAGCVEARPGGLAITDAAPSSSNPDTLFVPSFAPDERGYWFGLDNNYLPAMFDGNYMEPELISSYDWSRTAPNQEPNPRYGMANDREDVARGSQADVNKYLMSTERNLKSMSDGGPNSSCDSQPLTPLSVSESAVQTALGQMQAAGATNIPEGLAWGWRLVTPTQPFTEGKSWSEESNLKAIVLMTDGENTLNPSYSNGSPVDVDNENNSIYSMFGYATVQEPRGNTKDGRLFTTAPGTSSGKRGADLNDRMNKITKALCQNIKDDHREPDGTDGIIIFTIAFDVSDQSPTKSLLEDCASYGLTDPTKKLYYDAANKDQLIAAFGKITEEVSSLRIAR